MQMSPDNFATYVSTLKAVIDLIDSRSVKNVRDLREAIEEEIDRIKTHLTGELSHGRQN